MQKNLKNDRNPEKWVLIWEFSSRAFQWIPRWQGLDGFQKSLHPYALKENSLSILRVKTVLELLIMYAVAQAQTDNIHFWPKFGTQDYLNLGMSVDANFFDPIANIGV